MPDPQYTGMITTKTPVEQETACFLDDGTNLNELPYLRSIMNFLPTHLILGDVMDIWYMLSLPFFRNCYAYSTAKAKAHI